MLWEVVITEHHAQEHGVKKQRYYARISDYLFALMIKRTFVITLNFSFFISSTKME